MAFVVGVDLIPVLNPAVCLHCTITDGQVVRTFVSVT